MNITDNENAAHQTPPNAENKTANCPLCNGEMVAVDMAGGAERPSLVSENYGTRFSRDSLVPLERAHACLECGHVRLFVDPVKLRRCIRRVR